jgi:hypothetical protein
MFFHRGAQGLIVNLQLLTEVSELAESHQIALLPLNFSGPLQHLYRLLA